MFNSKLLNQMVEIRVSSIFLGSLQHFAHGSPNTNYQLGTAGHYTLVFRPGHSQTFPFGCIHQEIHYESTYVFCDF